MAQPNIVFEVSDKNELFIILGVNGARRNLLAKLDIPNGYIFWKDEDVRDTYEPSAYAWLAGQKMPMTASFIDGQVPDKRPANAPPPPAMHLLQGSKTPAYLDDLLKYEPIKLENLLGIKLKPGVDRLKRSSDPRQDWLRANVTRTITGPTSESRGGVHDSIRFIAENQIIARHKSHITFIEREIHRPGPVDADGNPTEITADPFVDVYADLKRRVKDPGSYDVKGLGKVEVLWKRHAAATAGAQF